MLGAGRNGDLQNPFQQLVSVTCHFLLKMEFDSLPLICHINPVEVWLHGMKLIETVKPNMPT